MAKRSNIVLALAVIMLAATAGLLIWKWDALFGKSAQESIEAERQSWMERTRELEGIIAQMQKGSQAKSVLPTERLVQAFGPTSPLVRGVSPKDMKCEELDASLVSFCNYLDAGATLRSQKTYQDSRGLLKNIIVDLERRLPNLGVESYRPKKIIENSFHFFRLLHKERIDLVRDVLKNESDLSEPLMGILYYWLISGQECNQFRSSQSALKMLYSYGGFFLNTLGGQSYLLRRDSRIRLLTIYYATLALHESNLKGLNELGLDLRFYLPLVFEEIQSRNDLLYAEEYLQTLSNLQLHYSHHQ